MRTRLYILKVHPNLLYSRVGLNECIIYDAMRTVLTTIPVIDSHYERVDSWVWFKGNHTFIFYREYTTSVATYINIYHGPRIKIYF